MRQSMLWLMAAGASAAGAAAMAQPVPAALQACVHITQDSERLACFDREMAAASHKAEAHAAAASAAGAAAAAPAAAASNPVQPPAGNGAASAASPASAPASASTALAGAGAVGAAAGAVAASAASASPAAASAPGTAAAPLTAEDKLGLSADGIHKLEVERGITSADVKPTKEKELTAHIANVSRNAAGRAVVTLDNGQVWRQSETRSSFEAHAGDAVKIFPGSMGSFWLSTNTHNWTRVERLP